MAGEITDLPEVQRVWMIGVDVSEVRPWQAHLERGAHGKAVGLDRDQEGLGFPPHLQDHSESHVAVAARREAHRQGQPAAKGLSPLNEATALITTSLLLCIISDGNVVYQAGQE